MWTTAEQLVASGPFAARFAVTVSWTRAEPIALSALVPSPARPATATAKTIAAALASAHPCGVTLSRRRRPARTWR